MWGSTIVDCALYVDGVRHNCTGSPRDANKAADYRAALEAARRHDNSFVWLGLHDPSHAQLKEVTSVFGLREFVLEEMAAPQQRPKLVHYGEAAIAVFRPAQYVKQGPLTEQSEIVETGHIVLVLSQSFVITIRRGATGPLAGVRASLEARPTRLALGPWAVYYAVVDHAVAIYSDIILERFDDDVDEVETAVFGRNETDVKRIYQLRRELVEFKRAVMPLVRPLEEIADGAVAEVPEPLRRLMQGVLERHRRVLEQVISFDDLLSSVLAASLTQVGIQQNNDMRKISAWAAIAAIQTVIAGIYGMNFEYMPELHWQIGYPLILIVMASVVVVMYRVFRRSGWL